ncbi:MAG TPA: ATP-binding protein [Actinomycetota bacterium]|nr:ATP-binding protein [Actinomycetota bacterium]
MWVDAEAGPEATLELPPDAAYIATARIFGSALARHYGVPEGAIEDLKLALSEACAALVRGSGERMLLAATPLDGRLRYRVTGGALPGAGPAEDDTPSSLASVGLELIRALFEDAEITAGDQRASVSFSVPAG